MDKKIAAVVVTFNRKELLLKNVNMLLDQKTPLDKIIIIDNASTDGTHELLKSQKKIGFSTIEYIKLDENIGGAGGFYEGVKHGVSEGYDYLWLMDDDGAPYNETTFTAIMKKAFDIRKLGYEAIFLNSLVICDGFNLSFGLQGIKNIKEALAAAENGLIPNKANPFNGTLISKELIEIVGLPNKEFFIKGDENEYLMRCRKNKAYIATAVDSVYFHPSIPQITYRFLGKVKKIDDESPWKEYYRTRNYTYMYIQNGRYKNIIDLMLNRMVTVLVSKDRMMKLKMVIKGFGDGLFGRMGKRVSP